MFGVGKPHGRREWMGVAPPEKKLRFQALKSAFWWILEMVLLWIMVKTKKPSGLIRGSGPPWPSPWIRHCYLRITKLSLASGLNPRYIKQLYLRSAQKLALISLFRYVSFFFFSLPKNHSRKRVNTLGFCLNCSDESKVPERDHNNHSFHLKYRHFTSCMYVIPSSWGDSGVR